MGPQSFRVQGGGPGGGRDRSPGLQVLRRLLQFLLGVVVGVLGLVLGVLCFVLFPPSDLLRRAAVPLAQSILNHDNLNIGSLSLRPLDHVEITDIWLGPPRGYRFPLFTVRRIVVRYDLRRILQGEIRVRQVQVERPLLRVEQQQGKLNWIAFLEGLPSSETPPEPEEESKPSDFRIWLDRIAVVGIGAAVDDGVHRLALDSLNLALSGLYSQKQSHLHLALLLESRRAGRPAILVQQGEPRPLGAELDARLALEVRVRQLHRPAGELGLELELFTRKLKTPWGLDPVRIGLKLQASGDLPADRARLKDLRLSFNGSELVSLQAALKGLLKDQEVDVLLRRLHLPLEKLAPYARALVGPGMDLGGQINVRQLQITGPLSALSEKKLPRLRGQLAIEGLWASAEPEGPARMRARVRGLDVNLALATAAEAQGLAATPEQIQAGLPPLDPEAEARSPATAATTALVPPVTLQGRIRLAEAEAMGARIQGLDLRLASGAALRAFDPRAFAARLRLQLPRVTYESRATGTVRLALRTDLSARGDVSTGSVELDRLSVQVSDFLRLAVAARVRGWGKEQLDARVQLAPLDLRALLAWVPARLKAPVASLGVSGSLAADLKVQGRLPRPNTPPLRLPLTLDATVTLDSLGLKDPKANMALSGLGGTITVKGRPSDLKLQTRLSLQRFVKPDARLTLEQVQIPIQAHLTPAGIKAGLDLRIKRVGKADMGFKVRDTFFTLDLDAGLPTERLVAGRQVPLGRTKIKVNTGVGALDLAMPGTTLSLSKQENSLLVTYVPGKTDGTHVLLKSRIGLARHEQSGVKAQDVELTVEDYPSGHGRILVPPGPMPVRGFGTKNRIRLRVRSIDHALSGARLQGLALDHDARVTGAGLSPEGDLALDWAESRLKVGLQSLTMKRALPRPLKGSTVELEAEAQNLKTFWLKKMEARLPSLGLYLQTTARAKDLLPFSVKALPPLELTLSAGMDNPRTSSSHKATVILPTLKTSGQAGLQMKVRTAGPQGLVVDGRVEARAFNLWLRSVGSEPRKEGGVVRRVGTIYLKDLDGTLPIRQKILLRLPDIELPRPRRSIFDAQTASVLYDAMRPYKGQRAGLSVGGITLEDRIAVVSREGYLLSSSQRSVKVDRVAMDLAIADSTLSLSRLYIKLFGGDIVGSVQAQLLGLDPVDARLKLQTQITGVNLAHLDPEAKERTAKTEISALVDLKYWLSRQMVEGRVDITRLSLDMLDSLLAYLDPNKMNESVQSNRKLINSWAIKQVNPRVTLVSMWINHGNLNMDIEMDAWFVVGSILKRMLKNMRIRRVNILPFLPKMGQTEKPEAGQQGAAGSGAKPTTTNTR